MEGLWSWLRGARAGGARCVALTLAARETGLNVVRIDDERAAALLHWDGHGLKVVPRPW